MKKILVIIALCCFAFGETNAQVTAEQGNPIKFGITGGVNVSTVSVSYSGDNKGFEYNNSVGFNAGLLVDFPINQLLSIQPELKFSTKGTQSNTPIVFQNMYLGADALGQVETESQTTITSCYMELPFYLKAVFACGSAGKITAGVGPYFAYGVSGKLKNEYTLSIRQEGAIRFQKTVNREMDIFKQDEENIEQNNYVLDGYGIAIFRSRRNPLDRFDAGVSCFVGYEWKNGLFATIGGDLGLLNLVNTTDAAQVGIVGNSLYNRTLSISLGYLF